MKKAKEGVRIRIRGLGVKLMPGYLTEAPGLTAWNDKDSNTEYGKAKKPWKLVHQASGYVVWSFRLKKELEQGVWLIGNLLNWEDDWEALRTDTLELRAARDRLNQYDASFLSTLEEWLQGEEAA